MPDREKIVNAIEKAIKQSEQYAQDCIVVPFKEVDMILALLKKQEAVEPITDNEGGYWCGSCHEDMVWRQKYCSNCGRPVKWD